MSPDEVERQRYQELFELAPDAYLVTDLEGIIAEANQSAFRLFGIPPQFLAGKALAAYIASEDRTRLRALLSEPNRNQGTRTTSFKLRTRDGLRLYAELTYSIIDSPDGKPVGFRWLVRDVTEQERLARQIRTLNTELESRVAERTIDLRAAQELSEDLRRREQAARRAAEASEAQSRHVQKLESLGVLAGGIAHDFNNLLHVVLGNADIALSRLPLRSSAREPLEEVVRATLRAADLTRQMLAYSGKGAFVVRHLDLSSEVREMATLLRTAISKKASLVWELTSSLPAVNADPTQIRQIVMNLITNASDALRDGGGTITLHTGVAARGELNDPGLGESVLGEESSGESGDPFVYLEVSDTGAGMSPDTLQRIFDPFFSTKFAGRGLGLAAVMGIVRSHQGLIRIRTEPGQGTRFRVLLPAVASTARKAESPSAARSDWRGSGTVLVVDDEEAVREVAERMLQEIGFDTITAVDGRDALEIMKRAGISITAVLLDLSMPSIGGQEALRRLREKHPELPVIMMSGYTEQAVAPQFSGSGPGITAFLQKPFLAEDLIGVFRRVAEVAPQDRATSPGPRISSRPTTRRIAWPARPLPAQTLALQLLSSHARWGPFRRPSPSFPPSPSSPPSPPYPPTPRAGSTSSVRSIPGFPAATWSESARRSALQWMDGSPEWRWRNGSGTRGVGWRRGAISTLCLAKRSSPTFRSGWVIRRSEARR